MNFEVFVPIRSRRSCQRKLQVISEAAIRIGPNATSDYPWLPWYDIAVLATGCATNMSG